MIEKSPKSETTNANRRTSTAPASASRVSESRSRLFEVVIAGVPLRLKSSHDEQTVNELVALVDRKVKEALPLTRTGSIQNAAILASLHLAEENLTLRRKAQAELERLERKTLKVISELESSRMTGLQGKENPADQRLDQDSQTALFDQDSIDNGGDIHATNLDV